MLLSIRHKTELRYSETIVESVMEMRVHPRVDERQVVRQFDVTISPEARVVFHSDWLGNTVHQFSLLRKHDEVCIVSGVLVETRPANVDLARLVAPLEGLVSDHRWRDFLGFDGPVMRDERLAKFASDIGLAETTRVGDTIRLVLARTSELAEYRKGVTNTASTVHDVLDARVGVCQDFAHLALALLRERGVPCRYVSGYLYQEGETMAESHAWCEAYVPGVGWVGFDPTHGELVGERHVSVAAGRNYSDVPPNRGVFRGTAQQSLVANVAIRRADHALRGRPFTPIEQPVKLPLSTRSASPGRISYHQEHQTIDTKAYTGRLTQQRQQQQQ